MANNPNLYNAAVAGITGGNLERWLSTNAADASLADAVGSVATAIDAAIDPIEGGGDSRQVSLMQAVCQGVMAGRSIIGLNAVSYAAIAAAIAAAWTECQTVFDPTGPDTWGAQTSWSVDPATGSDSAAGTPAAPLASVTELNRRLQGLSFSANTTIQLVGNQTEALNLVGTQIADGATLTIQGTVTQVGTGSISTVTAIGGAGTVQPWRLVTTGIDWTTADAQRLEITNGASLGAVAPILRVIDANTIEIPALGGLSGSTNVTPTNTMTFAAQTLSTIPMSAFLLSTVGQLPATVNSVVVRDLHFTEGAKNATFDGPRITVFGCTFDIPSGGEVLNKCSALSLRLCRILGNATDIIDFTCPTTLSLAGCAFIQGLIRFKGVNLANSQFVGCAFEGAIIAIQGPGGMRLSTNGLWMQNVNTTSIAALNLSLGAVVVAFSTASRCGGTGITGIGIAIESGSQYLYNSNAAVKPTLAGSVADTKIGGTNTAYASIPTINATNNAAMVVIA